MKKRLLSLALIAILLIGLLAVPASAASPKDVFNYLVSFAKKGTHSQSVWANGFSLNDDNTVFYIVAYDETNKKVQCIITDDFESYDVYLELSSNTKLPYDVYAYVADATGSVKLYGGYNGAAYTNFASYQGSQSYKSDVLGLINNVFPAVLEFTRAVIYQGGYTLSDMGLTAYKKCSAVHCFNSGKVTKAPTCGATGVKTYTCTVCNKTQTETIAATGKHTWSKQGTYAPKPTCTTGGNMEYRCTVCNATKKDAVPALGHSWDKGVTSTAPGCTTTGTKLFTCTRCKDTRTEQIPAQGHVWTLTERLTEPTEENPHGTALYSCKNCSETKQANLCAGEVFTDMPADGNWAHAPIDWAWLHGVTNGTSDTKFSPNESCTRAQVVTFLWKAAGKPEPTSTETAFTDLNKNSFYYKAVLWAAERGITNGTSTTTFSPNESCTRAQVVTFLWNAAGKPQPKTAECPFTDVQQGRFYTSAVLWASENNVTNGTSATIFSTNETCTRAQFVTFLYRASLIPVEEPTPEEPAPEEPAPEEPAPEEPAPEEPAPEEPAPEEPAPEEPSEPVNP